MALVRLGPGAVPDVLRVYLGHRSPEARGVAFRAISLSGRTPVPYVVEAFEDANAATRVSLAYLCAHLRNPGREVGALMAGCLESEDSSLRFRAAIVLGQMGTSAREFLPNLRRVAAQGPAFSHLLNWALCRAGGMDEALPRLVEAAEGNDHSALWFLSRVGPEACRAVDMLRTKATGTQDPAIAELAMNALVQIGATDPNLAGAIVDDLMRIASDGHSVETQISAIDSLKKLGPWSAPAVPCLIKALENPRLRVPALSALGYIGKPAADAMQPALAILRDDKDFSHRNAAAFALGYFGSPSKPAVPLLAELVREANTWVGFNAVGALGNLGPDAASATPILVDLLHTRDSVFRSWIAWVLGEMETADPNVIAALESMRRNDPDLRCRTVAGLALLRSARKYDELVPALVRILREGDYRTAPTACFLLRDLGPRAAGAVEDLKESLSHGPSPYRPEAAKALGYIGAEARSAIPALLEAAQDYDGYTRDEAVKALARIHWQLRKAK